MTAAPRIAMDDPRPRKTGEVLLGEDWVSPDATVEELRETRTRGGLVSLNRSPLARKIIIFNLMALVILVAGVLFLNPFRDSLVLQREAALVREAELISDIFEAQMQPATPGFDYAAALSKVELARGSRPSSSTRPAGWWRAAWARRWRKSRTGPRSARPSSPIS